MAEPKTKPTGASVEEYLASRASADQLADCKSLIAMFERITGQEPKMWGPSIVGFGVYRYPLAGGKSGESCASGFAIRGKDIVLYLLADPPEQSTLLERLGKHKMGKACLYFKRLADLDQGVLERLVVGSLSELQRRYG